MNLAIPAGRRVALLGANGSGKSTLLRILDGLAFPQKGSVLFSGSPLRRPDSKIPSSATDFAAAWDWYSRIPTYSFFPRPFLMK